MFYITEAENQKLPFNKHSLFSFLWIWPANVLISSRRVWSSFFMPNRGFSYSNEAMQILDMYVRKCLLPLKKRCFINHFKVTWVRQSFDSAFNHLLATVRPEQEHVLSSGSATPRTVFCLFSRSATILLRLCSPSWISCTWNTKEHRLQCSFIFQTILYKLFGNFYSLDVVIDAFTLKIAFIIFPTHHIGAVKTLIGKQWLCGEKWDSQN